MLYRLTFLLIKRAEDRLGVLLDYTRKIAQTDLWLLMRYNKFFGFLDPNRNVPKVAYHIARLRGAIAADCGTCVIAEINLAKTSGMNPQMLEQILAGQYEDLSNEMAAVARLADCVVGSRTDDPVSRKVIEDRFGDAGLIELSFAMNGAALLPGIKRAMGYAVVCDLDVARNIARQD